MARQGPDWEDVVNGLPNADNRTEAQGAVDAFFDAYTPPQNADTVMATFRTEDWSSLSRDETPVLIPPWVPTDDVAVSPMSAEDWRRWSAQRMDEARRGMPHAQRIIREVHVPIAGTMRWLRQRWFGDGSTEVVEVARETPPEVGT